MTTQRFKLGDRVIKSKGDYTFTGEIRAAFTKASGAIRYVVENPDGILHIFSDSNLEPYDYPKPH